MSGRRVRAVLLSGVLALAVPAQAGETRRPGFGDPRMRTVDYDPAEVVRITGAFRTATEVVLGADETITHVALGDSSAWDVAAEKNILFLKPKVRRGPTNLLVTAAKGETTRTYTFELATRAGGRGAAAPAFQLQFRYPADARARAGAAIDAQEAALRQAMLRFQLERGVLEGARNLAYSVQGPAALAPAEASDNGRFTVLRFPAAQAAPAVFALADDGSEALVPFDVRGEFVVVHGVFKALRLRRGRAVACLWNDAYAPYGAFTGTLTATSRVERIDKGRTP